MSNEPDPTIDEAVRDIVEQVIDEKVADGTIATDPAADDTDVPDYDDDEDVGLPPDPGVFSDYADELDAAKEAFDG